MKIKDKNFESIVVTNLKNEVVAIISDNEIVEYEDYKVILQPQEVWYETTEESYTIKITLEP